MMARLTTQQTLYQQVVGKTDTQTIPKGSYYSIQFGKTGDTAIDISEISNLNLNDIVRYEEYSQRLMS